jgi:hypothetical protein
MANRSHTQKNTVSNEHTCAFSLTHVRALSFTDTRQVQEEELKKRDVEFKRACDKREEEFKKACDKWEEEMQLAAVRLSTREDQMAQRETNIGTKLK